MHVHSNDTDATNGIRAYIGMKAKLTKVAGTQTFHNANISSLMLVRYSAKHRPISGSLCMTSSLVQ